jgi:hypothetical protein
MSQYDLHAQYNLHCSFTGYWLNHQHLCLHGNSTTYFGHTALASGINYDSRTFLICIIILYSPWVRYVRKFYHLNRSGTCKNNLTFFNWFKMTHCVPLYSSFLFTVFWFPQRWVFRGCYPGYICSVASLCGLHLHYFMDHIQRNTQV